ncbi:aldehyde dehydrogenase family protein [Actinomyces minihominis]|uniref:aldehyde dehydrogenase family protein n=1 Tax=Actinomyces minihominis TaxID=2002838 RepID=UPI000C078253|nr:aldehyde dehydrogenase family protein [Actinomyces minihominis]
MQTYEELLDAVVATDGDTVTILAPATEQPIGDAPWHDEAELEAAIARAQAAQPAWAALSSAERADYLNRAADAIEAAAEPLAQLLAREVGKPLGGANARFEVGASANWLRATAAQEVPVETLVDDGETYAELHYRPIGVVGAITPWNWPMMIATWQIAPSLRVGNTVVIKPSEYTPFSGLALAAVINQVLPEGVLNVVVGDGELGAAMTANPAFGKIMFTGSTATGTKIIESSAANITRLTMELGGNDAGIVLADADPQQVAGDIFWGAFLNTGQTCAALKRLYVHDDIYDQVVDAIAQVAKSAPMGDSLDEDSLLGPVQNKRQWKIVDTLVKLAVESGARVVVGGNPDPDATGYFYPATIVADIDPENALVVEEQFGPALPIVRYSDIEDALRWANALDVGLGASVWGSDRAEALKVAERMEAGTVWINKHGAVHPFIPFGGTKRSGYGMEFGVEGLKAVSVPQVING